MCGSTPTKRALPTPRRRYPAAADALYLPKASPERIDQIDRVLAGAESKAAKQRLPLVALIEDAAALLNADRIAAHPRVIGLSCGGEDLANALGARPDADVLRLPKQLIHYAAKAHGRRSYGLFQSTADYADLDRLKLGAEEARRFGFERGLLRAPFRRADPQCSLRPEPR